MTIDADTLTPTQELVMEVLAARYRLGEYIWTFTSRVKKSVTELESAGLVGWKGGIVEKTIRVWLTEAGKEAFLSATYEPPIFEKIRSDSARALADEVKRIRERGLLPGELYGPYREEFENWIRTRAEKSMAHE